MSSYKSDNLTKLLFNKLDNLLLIMISFNLHLIGALIMTSSQGKMFIMEFISTLNQLP